MKENQSIAAKAKALMNAKSHMIASLKDPDSVKFRAETSQGNPLTICGEINAKNSLGGYVGFKRFISKSGQFIIEGGSFAAWRLEDNPTQAPEEFYKALEWIEAGRRPGVTGFASSNAEASAEELFSWLWATNCK